MSNFNSPKVCTVCSKRKYGLEFRGWDGTICYQCELTKAKERIEALKHCLQQPIKLCSKCNAYLGLLNESECITCITIRELEKDLIMQKDVNSQKSRLLEEMDERIEELEEDFMVVKHASVMKDAEIEAADERIKELEKENSLLSERNRYLNSKGCGIAEDYLERAEAAEAKVKKLETYHKKLDKEIMALGKVVFEVTTRAETAEAKVKELEEKELKLRTMLVECPDCSSYLERIKELEAEFDKSILCLGSEARLAKQYREALEVMATCDEDDVPKGWYKIHAQQTLRDNL